MKNLASALCYLVSHHQMLACLLLLPPSSCMLALTLSGTFTLYFQGKASLSSLVSLRYHPPLALCLLADRLMLKIWKIYLHLSIYLYFNSYEQLKMSCWSFEGSSGSLLVIGQGLLPAGTIS